MNNNDDQIIDFTYSEVNGVVRIEPSDADYDYIYGGSTLKAFKTVLPVIILSLAMFIGSFYVEDYLPVLESSEGSGSLISRIILVASLILLGGSALTLPMISDVEEKKRDDEVLAKNVRKYKQLHREQLPPITREEPRFRGRA